MQDSLQKKSIKNKELKHKIKDLVKIKLTIGAM
jgi:hypothetical protein